MCHHQTSFSFIEFINILEPPEKGTVPETRSVVRSEEDDSTSRTRFPGVPASLISPFLCTYPPPCEPQGLASALPFPWRFYPTLSLPKACLSLSHLLLSLPWSPRQRWPYSPSELCLLLFWNLSCFNFYYKFIILDYFPNLQGCTCQWPRHIHFSIFTLPSPRSY
jgi:hypothetical protein